MEDHRSCVNKLQLWHEDLHEAKQEFFGCGGALCRCRCWIESQCRPASCGDGEIKILQLAIGERSQRGICLERISSDQRILEQCPYGSWMHSKHWVRVADQEHALMMPQVVGRFFVFQSLCPPDCRNERSTVSGTVIWTNFDRFRLNFTSADAAAPAVRCRARALFFQWDDCCPVVRPHNQWLNHRCH